MCCKHGGALCAGKDAQAPLDCSGMGNQQIRPTSVKEQECSLIVCNYAEDDQEYSKYQQFQLIEVKFILVASHQGGTREQYPGGYAKKLFTCFQKLWDKELARISTYEIFRHILIGLCASEGAARQKPSREVILRLLDVRVYSCIHIFALKVDSIASVKSSPALKKKSRS